MPTFARLEMFSLATVFLVALFLFLRYLANIQGVVFSGVNNSHRNNDLGGVKVVRFLDVVVEKLQPQC